MSTDLNVFLLLNQCQSLIRNTDYSVGRQSSHLNKILTLITPSVFVRMSPDENSTLTMMYSIQLQTHVAIATLLGVVLASKHCLISPSADPSEITGVLHRSPL